MKKLIYSFFLLTSIWTFQACDNANNNADSADTEEVAEDANEEKKSGGAEDDADFMVKAASGGMAEVQMGQLAVDKATDPQVKAFGQMMVTDHSKANEELKALAASKNITLPTALGDDYMENLNDLNKLSGKDFDEKYMDIMVKDHKEDVELFEDAANDAHDADIKDFAVKTLPILKMHLDHAQNKEDHTDHNH